MLVCARIAAWHVQAEEHETAERDKAALTAKLSMMQEKLLVGGQILDKAAKQEAELRQAQVRHAAPHRHRAPRHAAVCRLLLYFAPACPPASPAAASAFVAFP